MRLVLVTSIATLVAASTAAADTTEPRLPKKLQRLADKNASPSDAAAKTAWQKKLADRVGKEPPALINIFNTWTHETIAVEADPEARRRGAGSVRRRLAQIARDAGELANRHLRCHFTNQPTDMDPRLFAVLVEAASHFGVERVEIISGFRAQKYNLTLRKKGREVARNSQHTKGHAVDFRLPGVSTTRLRNWARGLKLGGVGYYPSSGFIHVDVGRVRTWRGK